MVKIQRRFLWSGVRESSKICWVKWDRVCRPIEKGGLGVKNIEWFNYESVTHRKHSQCDRHKILCGGVDEVVMLALRRIWKTKAPRKSMVFAWKLLLHSLPVHQALVRRGVLFIHEDCVFCNNMDEDVTHLFLHCDVASSVWYYVDGWVFHHVYQVLWKVNC
uniref:Reverse transcriptase zinc-binding domain-containing protein n=1 Tax=Cajanus cajan TaxID=3821 RepID=A0A151RS84_CAJCA|nr:hypothetical protein KK1_033043 [Cajanus cajan]